MDTASSAPNAIVACCSLRDGWEQDADWQCMDKEVTLKGWGCGDRVARSAPGGGIGGITEEFSGPP